MPELAAHVLPASAQHSWLLEFHPFTLQHVAMVGLFALIAVPAAVVGRKARGTPAEARVRRVAAWLLACYAGLQVVFYLLPSQYDPAVSYPLQLCDLAVMLAPLALGWQYWRARALLYFWGVLLSSQGLCTPTLDAAHGMGTGRFWMFWISHGVIVGAGLYDLIALGYRPSVRDLRLAWVATLVYGVMMILVDLVTGYNYGFVGRSPPGGRTVVDFLGPWPWRLIWMAVGVLGLQWGAWAVWGFGRKVKVEHG